MPDDQTPQALSSSDRLSSEEFVSRWSALEASLRRFCRRKLGDPDEADEVVQQVAFNAWSGFESLRDSSRFEAWVFVLAANEIKRTIGLKSRIRTRSVPIEDQEIADPKSIGQGRPSVVTSGEGWIDEVIDRMTESRVLKDKVADVVRHHLHPDRPSWQETGRALGISAGDCAATFSRAIPRVRQWILCHHPEVVGGTKALAAAVEQARMEGKNPLNDAELAVFTARVLNGDTGYHTAGWRTALSSACKKVLHFLQLS